MQHQCLSHALHISCTLLSTASSGLPVINVLVADSTCGSSQRCVTWACNGPTRYRRRTGKICLDWQVLCMISSICADERQRLHRDQARVMQRVLHVQSVQGPPLETIQMIVIERFDARVLIECCSLLECVDVDSLALSIYSSKCFMPMPWTTR